MVLPTVALLELGGDRVVLFLVAGVFLVTFLVVFTLAYFLWAKKKPGPPHVSTWDFNITGSVPLSKDTADLITNAASGVLSKPVMTAEAQDRIDPLGDVRRAVAWIYRGIMIATGLVGLVASALMFLEATAANMMGLPAAIVLILSLGALWTGVFPSRSITGVQAFDFRPLLDKVDIQVDRSAPVSLTLSETDVKKAADLVRQGLPLAEAARAVYPGYDRLDGFQRQAIESALEQMVERF